LFFSLIPEADILYQIKLFKLKNIEYACICAEKINIKKWHQTAPLFKPKSYEKTPRVQNLAATTT
jgi:hypothetical protein